MNRYSDERRRLQKEMLDRVRSNINGPSKDPRDLVDTVSLVIAVLLVVVALCGLVFMGSIGP